MYRFVFLLWSLPTLIERAPDIAKALRDQQPIGTRIGQAFHPVLFTSALFVR